MGRANPRAVPQPPWAAFSAAERNAAIKAVEAVLKSGADEVAIASSIGSIVKVLSAPEQSDASNDADALGRIAAKAIASEGHVDLAKPFADTSNEISAAVLGAFAEGFTATTSRRSDVGFVSTPWRLAFDMVTLSAYYWLRERIEVSSAELRDHLWGIRPSLHGDSVARELSKATWYDPCVGGGVFPLCIVLLCARLGIRPEPKLGRKIFGVDLSTVASEATTHRLWLLIDALLPPGSQPARMDFRWTFRVTDALASYTEQQDSLATSKTDLESMDIVIGNPPYVRASRLSSARRRELKLRYPSVGGGFVDLYQYFIAHGVLALSSKGILCYISPAGFQRSASGSQTRRFLEATGSMEAIFDFDELSVFEEAALHASVYIFRRNGAKAGAVDTFEFTSLPTNTPLLHGLRASSSRPRGNFTGRGWVLDHHAALIDQLEAVSRPLEDITGGVYSGVKTGLNTVYILDHTDSMRLLTDELSAPYVKPVTVPVCIRRWKSRWDGRHMIVARTGDTIPSDAMLMSRLQSARERLEKRADLKPGDAWYHLRQCAYFDLFRKPKIIFPDIATEPRFALDMNGHLIPDGAFMLPVEDYFLLGVLNSSLATLYFRARCNRIGNPARRGRLRFKKAYVRAFPVPEAARTEQPGERVAEMARELVRRDGRDRSLERDLDASVAEAYGLPKSVLSQLPTY